MPRHKKSHNQPSWYLLLAVIIIVTGIAFKFLTNHQSRSPLQYREGFAYHPTGQAFSQFDETTSQAPSGSIGDTTVLNTISSLNNQLMQPRSLPQVAAMPGQQAPSVQAQLLSIAKRREDLMTSLAEQDPKAFLSVTLPPQSRAQLPAAVQEHIEQKVVDTGTMEVLHMDDFEQHKGFYQFTLNEGQTRKSFLAANPIPPALAGARVQAEGFSLKNLLVSPALPGTLQVLQAPPQPDSIGEQKTLVLLVDFLDSPPRTLTKEQVERTIFNDGIVNAYYKEQSYGKTWLTGTVMDWYKLQRNKGNNCYVLNVGEIEQVIHDLGIDFSGFSRLIIIQNVKGCTNGFGSIGKWQVAGRAASIDWVDWGGNNFEWGFHPFPFSRFELVAIHEFGHNLGLFHANGWRCNSGGPLTGNCRHEEYGNDYDVMGRGIFSLQFNGFHKDFLYWFDPESTLTISNSGTYTLYPLEEGKGARTAKILLPGIDYPIYYLEFRQGIGFDAGLNSPNVKSNTQGLFINTPGLFVNLMKPQYPQYSSSLLDLTPPSPNEFSADEAVTLNQGVFDDKEHGILIGNVKVESNKITFDVKIHQNKPPQLQCILTSNACQAREFEVLQLSDGSNAHAALPGKGYPTRICCSAEGATIETGKGNPALYLSGAANAHASITSSAGYSTPVTIGISNYQILCHATKQYCSGLKFDTCLVGLASQENSHVTGFCGNPLMQDPLYPHNVCCSVVDPANACAFKPDGFWCGEGQACKKEQCIKEEVKIPPNLPPIPSFTATPAAGKAPLSVSFDASASSDPDGTITKYEWDFGENAYATVSASGRTTQHTYSTAGTYKARLNVTDDKGAYARSEPIQVIVQANQPPVLIGVSGPNPNLIRFTRYQPKVFTILAHDPDGDRLQYKLQQPPPWVSGFVRMYASGEGDYGRSASYQYMDSPRFMILGGMGCVGEVTVFVTDGTAEVSKTIQYSICNKY